MTRMDPVTFLIWLALEAADMFKRTALWRCYRTVRIWSRLSSDVPQHERAAIWRAGFGLHRRGYSWLRAGLLLQECNRFA